MHLQFTFRTFGKSRRLRVGEFCSTSTAVQEHVDIRNTPQRSSKLAGRSLRAFVPSLTVVFLSLPRADSFMLPFGLCGVVIVSLRTWASRVRTCVAGFGSS